MRSIGYVSTATAGIEQSEVIAIAKAAGDANAEAGISGLLLFNGFNFLQLIEGEDEVVESCFRRIASDPRHHGVIRVRDTQILAREFPGWGMRGQLVPSQYPTMLTIMHDLPDTVGAATLELLDSFASIGVDPN